MAAQAEIEGRFLGGRPPYGYVGPHPNPAKAADSRRLHALAPKTPAARWRMTRQEITSFVTEVGGIMQALNGADPADKAEVYGRLGITLTYHPSGKRVQAEVRPGSIMYVGACPRRDCTKKPSLIPFDVRVCA
jgi:hypothetical protein